MTEPPVGELIPPMLEDMIVALQKYIKEGNWERARFFAAFIAEGCGLKASEAKVKAAGLREETKNG